MKKTLLAATSLLVLVAFGANAAEDGAKMEAVKTEVSKTTETTASATTDAAKPAEGAVDAAKPADAVPAVGEVKKEEKKEEAK